MTTHLFPYSDAELQEMKQQFHQACMTDWSYVFNLTGYLADRWVKSMRMRGAYDAAVNLISEGGGNPQQGFHKIMELDFLYPDEVPRLRERTVEYSVLRLEWRPIFESRPDVIDLARSILLKFEVVPPDRL